MHRAAAAAAALAETSYAGTSLTAIADTASANRRTVYKVIGTKFRLLSRLVDVSDGRRLLAFWT